MPDRALLKGPGVQRDPEVFFGQLEAWGTNAKKIIVLETSGCLALPPKVATRFWKMCGFLASVLQASPKTLGQKTTSGSL